MPFENPEKQITPKNEQQKPVTNTEPILGKIPPIEGVFSPEEEVKKILPLPKEKRKEALAEFRSKLARQREAWGQYGTILEKKIEENPDISREEMLKISEDFASKYGFSEDSRKIYESITDDYLEKHRKVKEMREKFPDDIELINNLTGMNFGENDREDFKVVTGPAYFEIYCPEQKFGKIYARSMDFSGRMNEVAGFQDVSEDGTIFIVLNNDYEYCKKQNSPEKVASHERMHAKNEILKEKLFPRRPEKKETKEIIECYLKTKNEQEKNLLLREIMDRAKNKALARVKDEIFAKFKEGETLNEKNAWFDYFSPFRPYDFLRCPSNPEKKEKGYFLKYLKDRQKRKRNKLWKEAVKKTKKEYRETIENAIGAFNRLLENGYPTDKIIYMFSDKYMREWPKTAKRILEERSKRHAPKIIDTCKPENKRQKQK